MHAMISSPPLHDPELPALAVLTGPEARDLLDAAIDPDGRVLDARLTQIRYVPGKSVVAQFSAKIHRSAGGTSQETIVAASGNEAPGDALILAAEGVEVAMWRYPHDPALPGLAIAADPDSVLGLLEQLGAPASEVRLRRRAYRPGRRAVIEAVTPRARIYVKVLRPNRVAALQNKHTVMAAHLPVPHSFGWSADQGLVALQAMPGKTLRKALEGGKRRLPNGEQLIALLDAIPQGLETTVKGPAQRAPSHARLIQAVVPDLSDRTAAVVAAVSDVSHAPDVPVHGDFHSSQVMVRDAAVVGLIDVDTAGRGQRADDLAVMLAHLATLALASKARRNIDRYGATLTAVFDRHVDPRDLRLRTAASILGFATGPFRVQQSHWEAATEQRVALAEQWIGSATNAK
jgi:hypothetical protein